MGDKRYESVLDRRERIAMGEDPGKFRAPNGTVPRKPVTRLEKVLDVADNVAATVKQAFNTDRPAKKRK